MDDDLEMLMAGDMTNCGDLDTCDMMIRKVGAEYEILKEGLEKKHLEEGEGWDTPENGNKVQGN